MTQSYEPAEAVERLKAGQITLVDVRDREEWQEGHAKGALHVPVNELDTRATELPRDRVIVFVCQKGRRSQDAAQQLSEAGVDAGNVAGGMDAWVRAGLPVELEDRPS